MVVQAWLRIIRCTSHTRLSTMKIADIVREQIDESKWDAYVRAHSDGTLYHLSGWKNAITRTFGHRPSYFVALEGDTIVGVLPLFSIKTLFSGRKLVSIPFAMYGGILADSAELEQSLVDFAQNLYQREKADFLEYRYVHDRKMNLAKNEHYVYYVKQIEDSDEAILTAVPRKSRATIRNAYKKFGLTSRTGIDMDTMYRLYSINKRNLGSPAYPRKFFETLVDEFGKDAGMLFVYYNSTPIASVLYFVYGDTVMPYFSGADKTHYHLGGNNVMYYELLKFARAQGYRYFDFGRSRVGTGSGNFKKNMGFEPEPLHYYTYTHKKTVPNISPSNKKFNAAMELWSRLPLPIANFLGPRLVKYIP